MKFPKKVFVYVATESNGKEYLCVARDVEEIPEEADREMVGVYKLKRREQFVVRRILK
jgi:predicted transcriptional regulator